VTLTADPANQQAVLTVCDTGIGIEQDMLPRLFDIFAQADRSLDRSRGGLGLGLALVKGLVELHGGKVEAASDGIGRGTTFTICLPLCQVLPEPVEAPTCAGASGKHLHILVVEDNHDSADSLRMLLRLLGYEVSVAYSGPEGLQAARARRPDVIVCDIGLPGMDGFALAEALRNDPETADARLIAVTGYGQDADKERALQAGFNGHLTKPVDPVQLLGELDL
jgi:CheY-like chemotaxis protein